MIDRRFLKAISHLSSVLDWYFQNVYGRIEGGSILPFYCRREVIGQASVGTQELSQGDESAIFRLFLVLMMYQARRDVLIQAQQRQWSMSEAQEFLSLQRLRKNLALPGMQWELIMQGHGAESCPSHPRRRVQPSEMFRDDGIHDLHE